MAGSVLPTSVHFGKVVSARQLALIVLISVGLKLLSMAGRAVPWWRKGKGAAALKCQDLFKVPSSRPVIRRANSCPVRMPAFFHLRVPENFGKQVATLWAGFAAFLFLHKDIWMSEARTEATKDTALWIVKYRTFAFILELSGLSILFSLLSRVCKEWFRESAEQQALNVVTICIKVPLMLHCLFRKDSWRLLAAAPESLHEDDFNVCYWEWLLVAGFYFWELMINDPKPNCFAHHMTAIMGIVHAIESLPDGTAGNLIKKCGPLAILIATGGAPTISLPMFVCGLCRRSSTRKLALIFGAAAGCVLYAILDLVSLCVFYTSARSVVGLPIHIFCLPAAILFGIVPFQLTCFSRMFSTARRQEPARNEQKHAIECVAIQDICLRRAIT